MVGSAVLIVSVILTKIIGALFKIPIANILGGTGMGYFSSAYAIFLPVYAISVTGLPTAVSRLVAENVAYKRYANVRRIKHVAMVSFSVIGIICSVLILVCATPFAKYVVNNHKALPAIIAMAPCIYFGAVMAVYRGYYEGLRNMTPTAVSQVIEALGRLVCGLGFSYGMIKYIDYSFKGDGKVLGFTFTSLSQAHTQMIPYVAAASILGVTVSSLIGCIYLALKYKISGDGFTEQMLKSNQHTERNKVLLKKLVMIVIPISLGSVVTNLTSLIDLGTIMRSLSNTISNNKELIFNQYKYVFEHGENYDTLANFIYGSYTGLALTLFNLVPSLTNMFGKGIIPGLAEAWTLKDRKKITKSVNAVLMVTGLIAIPSGFGISALAEPVLRFLFSSREGEILTSVQPMFYLGIGVIFLSLTLPAFAMLQAIGRCDIPVKVMLAGVGVKLVGNVVLMKIPSLNISGAAISTTVCYLLICTLSLIMLKKLTKVTYDVKMLFLKPMYAGILCAVCARLVNDYLYKYMNTKLSLIIAIISGGLVYMFSLYLMDVLDKKSLNTLFFK